MAEISSRGSKILWEKEKLLVTSNFSFSHSVFKRHVLQTRENQERVKCFLFQGHCNLVNDHDDSVPDDKALDSPYN